MKITHILTSLQIGGAERFVIDLCEVQKKDHDVCILSYGKPKDLLMGVCNLKKIPVRLINTNIFRRNLSGFYYLKDRDIIHIHSPHALKTTLLPLLLLFYKKIIYTRHGEGEFIETYWILLHKIAQFFINHITFVSEKGKQIFWTTQQLINLPHHVIENGVSTENVEKIKNKDTHKLRIGSVGRMVKLKHQISLLQALQHLQEKIRADIEIHFFGDGECLTELEEFSKTNQLENRIVFHGLVTDRSLIYNNIDVLAVTSETEGLSLAIIEAMAYSCPVLATSVGGNPRLVLSGETGYLFAYNDVNELAALMEKLVNDKPLLKELGTKAKKHINEHFSLQNTAQKYLQLYGQ